MPYNWHLVQKEYAMTTLGHSLTGLAALTLCMPRHLTVWRQLFWSILFITLASVPDWPLPWWGHRQLAVSHSLWVNLTLCIMLVVALRNRIPIGPGQTRVLWCGGLTWLSHIGLDTLYGDLPGVAIYWPFSEGLASLPLPWLKSLPHVPPPFDTTVVEILRFEFITFAPLILIAWALRYKWPPKDFQK